MHNHGQSGGGPNFVPDTVPESSHSQGPAGYAGPVAPNPIPYDYMPHGRPTTFHQQHQHQPHQRMQHQQHPQQHQQHPQQPQVQPLMSPEFDVHFVQGGELGLWFGCPDRNGAKTVTGIKKGSQAAAVPQLAPYFTEDGQPRPGVQLELVYVNGIMVRRMPFEQALSAIQNAGRPLRLTLERISASTPQMSVDLSLPLPQNPSMSVHMRGMGGMGSGMGGSMGAATGGSMRGSMAGTVPGTMPVVAGGFSAHRTGGNVRSDILGAPALQTAHFAQTHPHIRSNGVAGPMRPAVGPGGA